jgi:hypothetical protein
MPGVGFLPHVSKVEEVRFLGLYRDGRRKYSRWMGN